MIARTAAPHRGGLVRRREGQHVRRPRRVVPVHNEEVDLGPCVRRLHAHLRDMFPYPARITVADNASTDRTAANRRLTFGITGRRQTARHQAQGLLVFGIGLALTKGSLALLREAAAGAPRTMELSALVLANLAATLLRFVLLRLWTVHRR